MLLVDQDQPQRLEGGKQGRAGADQDGGITALAGQPGLQSLPVIHAGVQGQDRGGKTAAEALQGLRRQADLRYQHQHLLTASQHRGDQL